MKKYFFLAAAAAMMLSACSNDYDDANGNSSQEERIPLNLGFSSQNLSAPEVKTRGNTDLQEDAVMTGATANTLGLFILKADGVSVTDNSFEKWNLASTSLTPDKPATKYVLFNSTTTTLYYPSKSTQLDIFAYAPYVSATSGSVSQIPASFTDINSQKITFYTQKDQTTAANYMASDVLWGVQGKANSNKVVSGAQYQTAKTAAAALVTDGMLTDGNAAYYGIKATQEAVVVVPMKHMGSKIIVNVEASGIALEKLQNATVKFYVDHTQGLLNVKNGTFVASTSESAARQAITLTSHLGIQSTVTNVGDPVTMEGNYDSNTDSKDDGYSCNAVIVPQTNTTAANNGNDAMIEIVLKSDNTASATTSTTYSYKNTAFTFESGKKYTFKITLTATGLQVTTTVANWENDTWGTSTSPQTGTANLQ